MNKNSIIGFILIAAIMVGYTYWMSPSEEELAKRQFVADSIAQVQNQRILEMEMMAKAAEEEEKAEVLEKDSVVIESPEYSDLQSKYDKFANAAAGEEQNFIIENDLLKLELSNKGGYIKTVELKDYKTYDSLPVILLDPNTTRFGLSFFSLANL